MPKNRAELRPAFVYTCDNCGVDNIAPLIISEVPIETEYQSENPMMAFGGMVPARARCSHCKKWNDLIPFNYGNSEDAE